MVQYAPVQHTPASPGGAQGFMSREEHAQRMRELNRKRALMRAPKRGFSMTDYQGDAAAPVTVAAAAAVPLPQSPYSHYSGHFVHQATIPEHGYFSPGVATPRAAAAATPATPAAPAAHQQQQQQQLPQRPKLPPPRRSYSVMDYEPAPPNQPAPSSNLTVLDLPPELHYAVIDQLDPLDSVCFGLAHPRLWAVHRRKHPRVALSARYTGPNDREWAWRGALLPSGSSSSNGSKVSAGEDGSGNGADLARMRTKGQVYCRKCGISRCELHRHLRDWMPEGWEYCEIRESFGKAPAEGAKASCTRSSPKNPNRCGRHGAARKVASVTP